MVYVKAMPGPEKGVITKGVFSLEESRESLKSLNSLESLENGRILLSFPQSGSSLETLESLNSLESLEIDFFEKTPFPKDPFSEPEKPNDNPTRDGIPRLSLRPEIGHFSAHFGPIS